MRRSTIALTACALAAAPAAAGASTVEVAGPTVQSCTANTNVCSVTLKAGPAWLALYQRKIDYTGRVLDDAGAAVPAGVPVTLLRFPAGASTPVVAKTTVTDAAGAFTFLVRPSENSIYQVSVDAQPAPATIGAAVSSPLPVYVRAGLTDRSPDSVKGLTYPIRGTVSFTKPRDKGKVVLWRCKSLQESKCKTLTTRFYNVIGSQKTTKRGTFAFSVKHSAYGTYRYVVWYKPTDTKKYVDNRYGFSITFRQVFGLAPGVASR